MCLLCACRQRCYCGRLLLSVASGYDEQDGPDSVKLQLDPEELCVLRAGVHWPEGQDHGAQLYLWEEGGRVPEAHPENNPEDVAVTWSQLKICLVGTWWVWWAWTSSW